MSRALKNLIVVFLFLLTILTSKGQDDSVKVIQFSGLVVSKVDSFPVVNSVIFIPKRKVGTSANLNGYFSLPVLPGDSVVFASLGFKKFSVVIPDNAQNSLNQVVTLDQDTLTLPMTHVYLPPSERQFKQELLAMRLPNGNYNAMQNNLSPETMSLLLAYSDMDASMNHTYYAQQQVIAMENRAINPVYANPLLNPFAWIKLVKDIQSEKKKKEERKKRLRNNQGY